MLNVPEAIKTLLKNESVPKNFRIHFPNGEFSDITNENLVAESVRFSESICSQGSFRFGLAEASVIEFETIGIGNMIGCTIEVSCEIDYNNEPYSIPYGTFVVNKCPRNHENMTLRRVTAYTENLKEEQYQLPIETSKKGFLMGLDLTMLTDLVKLRPSDMSNTTRSNIAFELLNSNGTKNLQFYFEGFALRSVKLKDSNQNYNAAIINIDYSKIEYDDDAYFKQFLKAFNSCSVPSGFMYARDYESYYTYVRAFSDTKQAFMFYASICTRPCYFLKLSAPSKVAFTQPVFIEPGKNIPVILENEKILYGSLTFDTADEIELGVSLPYIYTGKDVVMSIGGDASVALGAYVENSPTSVSKYPFTKSYWPISGDEMYERPNWDWGGHLPLYYKLYDLSQTNQKVSLASTAAIALDSTYYKTYYSYINAFKFSDLTTGLLELNAQFMKVERDGTLERFNLSNSPQEYLVPSDYISLWWDEYNVEPIGTVRYSYKDASGAMQTVDYNFGSGKSLYDMTDNFVLQNLSGASEEVINNLLDTYFIPNLSNIVFTPIDFYMRGLPYLEAGDLIDIESEDGVHVQSYIMTMDIDGIHNLTADITSVDGDTMYSEVTT